MKRKENIPVITAAIVIINIVVFLILDGFSGRTYDSEFMLSHGALSYKETIVGGEYYRLVTHFFMHFGVEHLANNMFVLAALGYYIENLIGRYRYLILYVCSGLVSGIVSLYWYNYIGEATISVGASGAIFGIIGAFTVLLIRFHGHLQDISFPRIILFMFLTLYMGYQNPEVDQVAHVTGFVTGALGMILLLVASGLKGDRRRCE